MTVPLLWVSLAFLCGTVLASVLHVHSLIWLSVSLLCICGVVALSRVHRARFGVKFRTGYIEVPRRAVLIVATAVAFVPVGGFRYQISVPRDDRSQVSWYNDAGYEVLVSGILVQPADVRDNYINLRLQTTEIDDGNRTTEIQGLLLARVPPNQEYSYGDILRLRGELKTPPSNEEFSYRDYLARQGIRSYMPTAEVTRLPGTGGNPIWRAVYNLKELALANVYRLFVDPEASLLAGILLGVDTGMPTGLEQAFNNTGTAHIIAISGFNIAIIAGLFAWIFNRLLGRTRGAIVALVGIVFYTFFVGADPPVLRAAIMGAVSLLAVQIGRRQVGMNTLAGVAAIMAMINPQVLWDVGFQLSILATLGLILYGGQFMDAARSLVERHFSSLAARKLAAPLGEFVFLTFAAQLTTLPIIAYHFRQISLVSPIANALVLPAQPAVMVLGGIAVSISLLIYPLAQLVAWMAWPLTTYTIRLVEFFAGIPQGVVYLGRTSLGAVVLFYAMLLAVTFAGDKIRAFYAGLRSRFKNLSLAVVIAVMFGCALFAWRLLAVAPDGYLHVTFLDVGSADAVLIQSPSGGRVLINGGPSASAASDGLGRRLSPIDHRLDWLVVASGDEDEVAALPRLLPRYPPRNVLMGAPAQASFSSAALMEQLDAGAAPVTPADSGQTLNLDDGVTLKVVDVSSRGSTLLLEWNAFRMLLPVGANEGTLTSLKNGSAIGPVSVLLLSESGYTPLTPPEWLANLDPQLVVLSVAPADSEGRPSPDLLELLKDYQVLRTDKNGWIEVVTDGAHVSVSTERN